MSPPITRAVKRAGSSETVPPSRSASRAARPDGGGRPSDLLLAEAVLAASDRQQSGALGEEVSDAFDVDVGL